MIFICIYSDYDEIFKHKKQRYLERFYKKFLQHFSSWPYLVVLSALFILNFYSRNGTRFLYFEIDSMRINWLSFKISFVKQKCLGKASASEFNVIHKIDTDIVCFIFNDLFISFDFMHCKVLEKHMFIEGRIINWKIVVFTTKI